MEIAKVADVESETGKTLVASLEDWGKQLGAVGKRLQAYARTLQKPPPDPFARRSLLDRTNEGLLKSGFGAFVASAVLRTPLENDCVRQTAEFWQTFDAAAKAEGWHIAGSTNRRLVARGVFLELKGETVSLEGLSGQDTPYVPALVEKMKPLVAKLQPEKRAMAAFLDLLARAYDDLGGAGRELPVEKIFRTAVLLLQPESFWSNMEPEVDPVLCTRERAVSVKG